MGQYNDTVLRGLTQVVDATFALTRKFNALGLKSARGQMADWFPTVVDVESQGLGVETTAYSQRQARNIVNFLVNEGLAANRSDIHVHSFTADKRRMWNITVAAEKIDEDRLNRYLAHQRHTPG